MSVSTLDKTSGKICVTTNSNETKLAVRYVLLYMVCIISLVLSCVSQLRLQIREMSGSTRDKTCGKICFTMYSMYYISSMVMCVITEILDPRMSVNTSVKTSGQICVIIYYVLYRQFYHVCHSRDYRHIDLKKSASTLDKARDKVCVSMYYIASFVMCVIAGIIDTENASQHM